MSLFRVGLPTDCCLLAKLLFSVVVTDLEAGSSGE